jgi:predicted  nucleic acid-binding Zn-ribbon protein
MDQTQLEKRVAWLDDEHRKDKNLIAMLEERINALESRIVSTEQKNKDLSGETTRLSSVLARMDSFDASIEQHRSEFNKMFKKQVTQSDQRVDEITTLLRAEIHAFDASLSDVRKSTEPISGLRSEIQARIQEEDRLSHLISDLQQEINELRRNEEEQSRIYRLIEDGRRQDVKRLTDIQGEITAVRKRSDEQRGRIDIVESNHRKIETRINELLAVERDRRDAQAAFLEKQSLAEVERERTWKDWKTRFEIIEKQSVNLESQLQILDSTHLSIKRMQDGVDELIARVERRINEIVEMQRLAEERFRQEWATFKADDQKRWTNYTLSQEEQRTETGRRFDRVAERVTFLEDGLQELQDLSQQNSELTINRLQSMLSVAHEWVSEFEKTRGS